MNLWLCLCRVCCAAEATFDKCKLEGVRFKRVDLTRATFSDSTLTGALGGVRVWRGVCDAARTAAETVVGVVGGGKGGGRMVDGEWVKMVLQVMVLVAIVSAIV